MVTVMLFFCVCVVSRLVLKGELSFVDFLSLHPIRSCDFFFERERLLLFLQYDLMTTI